MIYNEENFPILPESWISLTVGEAVVSAGNSNKKLKSKNSLDQGRFPVIDQGQNFVSGYSDDESLVVDASKLVPVILFGDHTRILKQISHPFVPGADGTKLLHAKKFWDTRFVFQMLRAVQLPDKGYARHYQHLRSSLLPLAPLNEQKRIADKLDTLLAAVDACRAQLNKVPTLIKRFRQSVLAAATSGALTEDWRERNPLATQINLEDLAQLRFRLISENGKNKKNIKNAVTPDENGPGFFAALPNSWQRVTIDQITSSIKDGPHFSPKYVAEGIPFISGGNIRPEGIDFSNTKFISSELHLELSKRCKPELNDILYTKGGTTGIARVNTEQRDFNVWVHVAVLRLVSTEKCKPFFIQHALNSPSGYLQSQLYTRGVGNQDLGLTRMNKIIIGLPPVTEQQEIIRRVEALFAVADKMEASLGTARKRVDQLTPSILAQAFRGELVKQDPTDEPASALLARIAAACTPAPPERNIKNAA